MPDSTNAYAEAHVIASTLREVAVERARQNARWGQQDHPNGTGCVSSYGGDAEAARAAREACNWAFSRGGGTWRHILWEEVCEAFAETDPVLLRAELIQVAAVAAAWVEAIDRSNASGDEGSS